ncbi:MAG TPA: hypothetical protein VNU68_34755 [Verrucomicrobiae bacterium]|nr:hypothetical protein [Verrucomicrobiae bacterium]
MSNKELQAEWDYRYQERIGILTDGAPGSQSIAQDQIATKEADQAIAELRAIDKLRWAPQAPAESELF